MGGRRPQLSRDDIALTALDILDTEGLSALTMRHLAARLGVRAASLYNHVSGYDEIIDLIQDLVNQEIDLDTLRAAEFADGLMGFARSYRDAFLRHPHALPHLVRRQMASPNALRTFDALAGFLARHGVPEADVFVTMGMIDGAILGASLDLFEGGFGPSARYAASHPSLATALAAADRDRVNEAAFELAVRGIVAAIESTLGR